MGDGGSAVVTAQRQHEHRWSARKKADAVVRLLRGESLEELSRELRVEAHRLQAWREEFVAGGIEGLKGKPLAGERRTFGPSSVRTQHLKCSPGAGWSGRWDLNPRPSAREVEAQSARSKVLGRVYPKGLVAKSGG